MTHISELRGKSPDELKEMALTLKKEMFNLRFQAASGEAANTARYRLIRRDIARVKTLLNEPKDALAKKPAKATSEDKAAKKAKAAAKAEALKHEEAAKKARKAEAKAGAPTKKAEPKAPKAKSAEKKTPAKKKAE